MKRIMNVWIACAVLTLMTACSSDKQDVEANGLEVVINSVGETSNGAYFWKVDNKTFYLDYVMYRIYDTYIEVAGYDATGISNDVKIYGPITYLGKTYNTQVVDRGVFSSCRMTSVTFPSTLKAIGDYAFCDCKLLKTINFNNEITTIGELAFGRCVSLKSVDLPEKTTKIGGYAFMGCEELSAVSLPVGLEYVGASAFEYCPISKLKSFSAVPPVCDSESVVHVSSPFSDYALQNAILSVPRGCRSVYQSDASWELFEHIEEM